MQKFRLVLLYFFLLTTLLAAGQSRQYTFTHYGPDNGLAAYNVRSIVQDETGFIWIGTINGLQRFDGSRYLTFRHNPSDTNTIPDNYVEQLLIDRDKNLWLVLIDGSIGIFDTKRFVFHKVVIQLSNPNNLQAIRKLQQDSQGNLFYIFPTIELLTYNKKNKIFSAANNFFHMPLNWKAVSIIDDPVTKKYWIGTDSGMVVYDTKFESTSYYGHNAGKEPFIEKLGKVPGVGCYAVDKKHRLWLLSWPINAGASRLYCYDLKNNEVMLNAYDLVLDVKKYIEPDFFLEQEDGGIWLSGLNIVAKYNEKDKRFDIVNNGYSGDKSIYYERANLFEDRQQNIWVATSNNGVYLFNPSRQLFMSIKHTNRLTGGQGGGYLMSFMPLADGTILAGAWGDGIYRYDSNFHNIPLDIKGIPEVNGLPIWDMIRLKDKSTIWMVGQPGLIYLYDEAFKISKRYDPPIFETKTIRQVEEDKLGNIWLGSQIRGLIKWVPSRAQRKFEDGFYKITNIPNLRVEKIMIDSKGFVWICTNKEGVYKIDPATDSIIDHLTKDGPMSKALLNNDASSIIEYNDSIMVIASGGLNIYNTHNGSIRYITSANGLPSDAVVSIEKDKTGFLWLGLMNGLCRMNLAKNTFSFFDRNDGIANDNFQVAASCHLPDGRMLFGSSNDFVVFNPDEIKTTDPPPDAVITEFKLPSESLLVDSLLELNRIELTPDQNSITIGFEGLTYLNKSKPVFYYMMEGIDETWKKANVLNQAVYNYLPANSYVFKVRAESADGVMGQKITTLYIKIKPPFWHTSWFASLLAFVAIGILFWIDKFRVSRIKDTERVRTRIATSLTKDMSSALSNINILSEMAKVKADKDMGRTKEYIGQISDDSNRMMEVMDDMIWSIDPGNDEFDSTLTRMRKFASRIQSNYNLEISFTADEKLEDIRLNMDRRYELFLIYKEALLNIGKHAGSKFADVHLSCDNATITMTIMDDGKGFNVADAGFGRGVNEMRKRAAVLKARLDISSEINTGTTIVLTMGI